MFIQENHKTRTSEVLSSHVHPTSHEANTENNRRPNCMMLRWPLSMGCFSRRRNNHGRSEQHTRKLRKSYKLDVELVAECIVPDPDWVDWPKWINQDEFRTSGRTKIEKREKLTLDHKAKLPAAYVVKDPEQENKRIEIISNIPKIKLVVDKATAISLPDVEMAANSAIVGPVESITSKNENDKGSSLAFDSVITTTMKQEGTNKRPLGDVDYNEERVLKKPRVQKECSENSPNSSIKL